MMTPEILQIVVWPSVVLAIGILFLLLFKRDISSVLSRLKKAKLPGGTETLFSYGEAGIDKPANLQKKTKKSTDKMHPEGKKLLNWSNSGNIFWAGHDLMWTIDVIVRGAPRETIAHGLRQSLHHVRSLGLGGTLVEARLIRLLSNAESSLQQDWTLAQRNEYAEEVASVIGYVGSLVENNQANFEPNPKG